MFSLVIYIRLKIEETALESGFVEQFADATINLKPIGFLCILGIQYINPTRGGGDVLHPRPIFRLITF